MNELERLTFELISSSGSARSYAFEALRFAKNSDIEKAEEKMENSKEEILKAHKIQTELIQKEARGEKIEVNILLVHAQDHLMSSILAKDLINDMIDIQKEIIDIKKQING